MFYFNHLLHFRNGDILIGGLTANHLSKKYFLPSLTFYYDPITWCVKRAQPITVWQNCFCIMKDREVWAMLVVAYYIMVYTFYYILKCEGRSYDIYTIMLTKLLLITNISSPYKLKSWVVRLQYAGCLFGNAVNIIVINAFLFNILMNSINKIQVDRIETLVEDYTLMGDRASLKLLIQQEEVWYTSILFIYVILLF